MSSIGVQETAATPSSAATARPSKRDADAALVTITSFVSSLPARAGLRQIESYRNTLDALEAKALAANLLPGGNSQMAAGMLDTPNRSKRDQRNALNRAKTVGENPELADKLASGAISGEHLDALAYASKQTNGDAARDQNLLDDIASTTPDQAKRLADDWVADRTPAEETNAEHARQRKRRNACRGRTATGLSTITLTGDEPSIDTLWSKITKLADSYYRKDGGRDLPTHKHPRTGHQRKFDAAFDLLTRTDSAGANGATRTPGSARPEIIITLDLDKLHPDTGSDHLATQLGVGPIPDHLLDLHWCTANLRTAILGAKGEPLWLSRGARTASPAQITALAIRDKGCVLCGADYRKCEAHHLTPFNAPAKGKTDIDQMALVCGPCHRQLHEQHHTLQQTPDGTWHTRPATRNEIAPRRPHRT